MTEGVVQSTSKKRWWSLAKLFLTGFFIFLVIQNVDLDRLLPLILGCQWEWVGACILIQFLVAGMNALRWKMLWPLPGVSLTKYLYFILLGQFFSTFSPSAAISEAMRILAFGRKYGHIQETIGVTLMARSMGSASQLFVAGTFAILHFGEWGGLNFPVESWNTQSFTIGCLAIVIIFIFAIFLKNRWGKFKFVQAFLGILQNRKLFSRTLGISILIQIIAILGTWTLFMSQTDSVKFWHMAVFGVFIQLILLLPLSVGGIGLREYLNLFFYGEIAGIDPDIVLAVSLVGYIPILVPALTGGFWLAFRNWQGLKNSFKPEINKF
jgi:uncharacterized membrane protein YbhN (UPF0104 family)